MKHYLIFLPFIFISCKSDVNDKSKRNDKWAWWVDANSNKGTWIPLSDHPTWRNGAYTKFYFNGKVYEKGIIRNGKNVDTIYSYDLNGFLYSYGIVKLDSTTYYYVKDGYIKILRPDSTIYAEGVIKDHTNKGKWTSYYKNGKIAGL